MSLFVGALTGVWLVLTLAQEKAAQPANTQTDARPTAVSPSPAAQGPNGAPAADTAAIIAQVTEWLRQRDGKLPEATEVVAALNHITIGLCRDGQFPEATQMSALALAHAEGVLGAEHRAMVKSGVFPLGPG